MEVQDNGKRAAAHIKRLAPSKAAPIYPDRDDSVKGRCKKEARTGVLPSQKQHEKNTPKHHGSQRYCITCKKSVIPGRKYTLHSSNNYFGNISDQASVRDGFGGTVDNRADAVKHYQKTEKIGRGI